MWRWLSCGSTWPPCLHISTCFVGVLAFGFALGVEELPATCTSLHPSGFPEQKPQFPPHKRDAQAPSTVDRRRKAFLKGGKNVTAALHWLWEGA